MGFAQEMRDFATGFQATAGIGQKISDRRAKRDATRGPTDAELNAQPGIPDGSGTIPQISTDTTTTGSTKLGNAGGDSFLQQAYGYYRQKGLGHAQAAGIAGNLNLESAHGDPRVLAGVRRGDAGSAAYAGQWRDRRLANLEKFAGGKPTLQQQFDFVLEEGNPNSPYRDATWVAAMPQFMAAKTPEEATGLFMNHFERPAADPKINGIAQRTAWASSLQDSGGAPAVAAAPAADAPAIPDPAAADAAAADPAAADPAADPTAAGITLPPEEQVSMAVPSVQADWTQQPLYAAQGGVIPEPHYAPGGTVDPYNPARDYTQAIPQPTGTFVPRRVGTPNTGALPAGPTPSQLAFRNRPKVPPVVPTVAPPPPVAPKAQYFVTPRGTFDGGNARGTGGGAGSMAPPPAFAFADPKTLDPKMRAYLQAYPTKYFLKDAQGKPVNFRSLGFEDGGVIPEVNFAQGGRVREVRESWHAGANVPGVKLIDPGTRYSARDDKEYFKPVKAKPKVQPAAATSTATAPASTPAPAAAAPAAAATPSADPRAAEMRDRQPAAPAASVPASDPVSIAGVTGAEAGSMVGRPHMGPPIPLPERNPMRAENQTLPAPPGPQPAAVPTPVIPDMIDQRVIAGPAAPAPAPVAQGPDHAAALKAAWDAIASGQNPKEVGQSLIAQGIDMSLWPAKMQNIYLGFAEGGVIPEQRQSWHTGGSTPGVAYRDPGTAPQAAPAAAPDAPAEDVRPTPKLMKDVSIALDGGVKFLTDHFGLKGQGEGAIPTRADQAQPQAAASRFAQGEGASTPEEIKGVDDAIDPNRQLSEGKRHLARLAKTVQWYEQQNRPKDAKAAAASLLQYGAQRFGQLGSLAGAAYRQYQQSQNPQDLQHAIKFMESAYEMIPDGSDMHVALDPATKTLVATRTTADGQEASFDITPDQIPQLIQGAQSKSAYWNSVLSMADPAGARQQAGWKHADMVKQGDRAYQARAADIRDQRASARARETALAIDARGAARDAAREKAATAKESRADVLKNPNYEVINPLLANADAAKKALDASPDDEALKTAYDQAASALYDALPKGAPKAQFMRDNGHEREMWSYVKAPPPAAAGPTPDAKQAADGKWYRPDPARPGKYILLEPAG